MGAVGLAAGASVGAWLELALLRRSLSRRLPGLSFGGRKVLACVLAVAIASGAGLVTATLLPPLHPALSGGATLLTFGIVYLLVADRLGASPGEGGDAAAAAVGPWVKRGIPFDLTHTAGLPAEPGVYLFHGARGEVLYVGKAKSLRHRVRSYLARGTATTIRTRELARQTLLVETLVVGSEAEALILEANLIKEHQPRFNIQLRDDKRYPYIKVTVNEPFPRVFVTRRVRRDGSRYFGPFVSVGPGAPGAGGRQGGSTGSVRAATACRARPPCDRVSITTSAGARPHAWGFSRSGTTGEWWTGSCASSRVRSRHFRQKLRRTCITLLPPWTSSVRHNYATPSPG